MVLIPQPPASALLGPLVLLLWRPWALRAVYSMFMEAYGVACFLGSAALCFCYDVSLT